MWPFPRCVPRSGSRDDYLRGYIDCDPTSLIESSSSTFTEPITPFTFYRLIDHDFQSFAFFHRESTPRSARWTGLRLELSSVIFLPVVICSLFLLINIPSIRLFSFFQLRLLPFFALRIRSISKRHPPSIILSFPDFRVTQLTVNRDTFFTIKIVEPGKYDN